MLEAANPVYSIRILFCSWSLSCNMLQPAVISSTYLVHIYCTHKGKVSGIPDTIQILHVSGYWILSGYYPDTNARDAHAPSKESSCSNLQSPLAATPTHFSRGHTCPEQRMLGCYSNSDIACLYKNCTILYKNCTKIVQL